jgi:hypothetical protein
MHILHSLPAGLFESVSYGIMQPAERNYPGRFAATPPYKGGEHNKSAAARAARWGVAPWVTQCGRSRGSAFGVADGDFLGM